MADLLERRLSNGSFLKKTRAGRLVGECMWAHGAIAVIGMWLLAAPDVVGYEGPPRLNHQISGAWIATFGMVAMSESVRAVRWVNVGLGLWLVIAPFIWSYPHEQILASGIVGLTVMALGCVRGTVTEQFGGGWSTLWRPLNTTDNT